MNSVITMWLVAVIFLPSPLWADNKFQQKLGSQLHELDMQDIADISNELCETLNNNFGLNIPVYNESFWRHFYLNSTEICSVEWENCKPEDVFRMLREYPVPFFLGDRAIKHGDRSWVFPFGRVYHIVDAENLLVVNVTMARQHFLSPGKVLRFVSVRDNNEGLRSIYIDTVGDGEGYFSSLNSALAISVWTFVDKTATDPWFLLQPFH